MKNFLQQFVAGSVIAVSIFALAPSAVAATGEGVCQDGTQVSGKKLKEACRDHGGVAKKAAAKKADAKKPSTKKVSGKAAAKSQAAGGGADKVWANTNSKNYHCPGAKFYGKTRAGTYMSESEAKAQGYKGKGCNAAPKKA